MAIRVGDRPFDGAPAGRLRLGKRQSQRRLDPRDSVSDRVPVRPDSRPTTAARQMRGDDLLLRAFLAANFCVSLLTFLVVVATLLMVR